MALVHPPFGLKKTVPDGVDGAGGWADRVETERTRKSKGRARKRFMVGIIAI